MALKKVVILSDVAAFNPSLSEDQQDTYAQVQLVEQALTNLGYDVCLITYGGSKKTVVNSLKKIDPLFVFNLVEADDKISEAPYLLKKLHLPYTGCPAGSIKLTTDKLLMKKKLMHQLEKKDIHLPIFVTKNNSRYFKPGIQYIIKAIHHHASIDIDDTSVITVSDEKELKKILIEKEKTHGKAFFAEMYIDGREFNLALLNGKLLPVAEIRFENYPADKVKIVGYAAKWHPEAFEYSHTVRYFEYMPEDTDLLERLKRIVNICSELTGAKEYARYDFRVDKSGEPYLLEINTNPCLSPDAGFFAACKQSGYTFNEVIKQIIDSCYAKFQSV